MSSRALLIAASVLLQAQIPLANRDDGVAHYYLQKGHKFDQHFELAVDRFKSGTAACDKSDIFKAIAGSEDTIKKTVWEEMFDKMDQGEKDEKITKDEMVAYLKTLSVECTQDQVDFIFKKFDKDGNGTIEKEEWVDKAWKTLDADESGTTDETEWNKAFAEESSSDTSNDKTKPNKDEGVQTTEDSNSNGKCDSVSIFGAIAADKKNIKEADWKNVFEKADANNDGSITNAEMVGFLKEKGGLDCKEDGVKFLFDKFDKDGNGLINADEWNKDAWTMLLKNDGPGHAGGDDGMINEDEWKAAFADDGKKGEKGTKSGASPIGGSTMVSSVAVLYLFAKAVEAFL